MADAPNPAEPAAEAAGQEQAGASPDPNTCSTAELLELLQADRLWLLRQLDGGAWPDWRLDLAALERELGELLDRLGAG
ncbi:MAG: hypothetical protein KFB97_09910 [Cyanobium sp. M30B3]|jgi:hypothetical protein|nr:MAG: hypothetical protein KFB97_09910 [Cyanobium sp. M30B3]